MKVAPTKADEFGIMLRCNALFGDLSPPMIESLARVCSRKTLSSGVTLFRRGDPGEALYGIRKGRMAIELTSASGQRITLSILGAGDLVGEIAVLDGGRAAQTPSLWSRSSCSRYKDAIFSPPSIEIRRWGSNLSKLSAQGCEA